LVVINDICGPTWNYPTREKIREKNQAKSNYYNGFLLFIEIIHPISSILVRGFLAFNYRYKIYFHASSHLLVLPCHNAISVCLSYSCILANDNYTRYHPYLSIPTYPLLCTPNHKTSNQIILNLPIRFEQ